MPMTKIPGQSQRGEGPGEFNSKETAFVASEGPPVSASEVDGCTTDAQRFCVEEHAWLLETARRASQKRGLQEFAEDIAHEVFKIAKDISDEAWSVTLNKKGYVARTIINLTNDLCYRSQDFEPLTENTLASTPIEAMDAAILVKEIYSQLSTAEQTLLDLMFQQHSGEEIANRLAIAPATARKRISRLKKKLYSLSHGKEVPIEVDRFVAKTSLAH